jgi:hypothetical protein
MMKMEKNIWTLLAVASFTTALAAGCGSSSDDADGGDAGTQTDVPVTETALDTASDGPVTFGISPGPYCYTVTAIDPTVADGCMLDVAKVVNMAIPATYDAVTGILKVGRDGSLGQGIINANKGTLMRSSTATDSAMPTCTWKQVDDSMVEVIATNEFTISVVENESMFATACTATPPGGMCTSSWKWTMKITAKTPSATTGQCE